MKKVFLSLAVIAMFSFVACNGNAAAEDTTAVGETQVEAQAEEPACEGEEAVDAMADAAEGEATEANAE